MLQSILQPVPSFFKSSLHSFFCVNYKPRTTTTDRTNTTSGFLSHTNEPERRFGRTTLLEYRQHVLFRNFGFLIKAFTAISSPSGNTVYLLQLTSPYKLYFFAILTFDIRFILISFSPIKSCFWNLSFPYFDFRLIKFLSGTFFTGSLRIAF